LKKRIIFTTVNKTIDIKYINAFKSGDNQSVGFIYDVYAVKLSMVAYKYLQNTQEAKDVVMDVFEKLVYMNNEKRKLVVPDTLEGFTGWLVTITKNYTLDQLKHKNIVARYQAESAKNEYLIQPDSDRIWDKQTVDYIINQLQGSEKQVASLHFLGYTHDEIANKLNVSYNTVRNQLSSAKKKIRKYISTSLIVLLVNLLN
jgi:RNA polymerase sigma-70 factor (ECF subfamily)